MSNSKEEEEEEEGVGGGVRWKQPLVEAHSLNEILWRNGRPRLAFFLPCRWQLLGIKVAHPAVGEEAF